MKEWFVLVFFGGTLLYQALSQDAFDVSDSGSRCGPFWFENPMTGLCYRLTDEKLTYSAARAKCRSFRGRTDLCSVNSVQEQYFISSLLASRKDSLAWIGFTDARRNNNWRWTDNSQVSYRNWASRQPNNRYDCAYVANYFKWYSFRCDVKFVGCCKKVPVDVKEVLYADGVTEKENDWVYFPETEKEYKPIYDNKTWKEAETYCKNLTTTDGEILDLVSIHSQDEQDFVNGLIDAKNPWWIGLTGFEFDDGRFTGNEDEDKRLLWRWSDRSQVNFTYWPPEEDFSNSESFFSTIQYFVYFTKGSYWLADDRTTDDPKYFVCQKSKE